MTNASSTPAEASDSQTAALALGQLLIDRAKALSSDDLATVADAMTAVRAGARELEASLIERGWGGDVLNGWGQAEDDDKDRYDGNEEDEEDEEDVDDQVPESAERVSYQSRADFYLVDREALARYVMSRASEAGLRGWDQEYVDSHDAFYCFTELEGLPRIDLTDTGLLPAGAQSLAQHVVRTLWELQDADDDREGDTFPTA